MTRIREIRFRCIVFIVGLAVLTVLFPASKVKALSFEEEREMGEEILQYIKKHMVLIEDPLITSYVNALGHKILKKLGPQPFDYRFFVIDNDVVNAFATPGGYIYINSGLIVNFNSEGQLAAILGHEIAHVTSRHISKRISNSTGLTLATVAGVIAGALIGGPIGSAVAAGSMGGGVQAQLAYSRADEREADAKGLDYLAWAGYDPRFSIQAFRILLATSRTGPKDVPSYMTTHPALAERISLVEADVAAHPAYGHVIGEGDLMAFWAIRNRTVAMTLDTRSSMNFFESILRKDKNNPWGYHGLGLVYQNAQDFDQAIRYFKKALAIEPSNTSFMTDLGNILYQTSRYSEASAILGQALILKPELVSALFLLARTSDEMGNSKRARDLYERALKQDPNHMETLYFLGVLYGRQGDLARAHLYSGLHFQKNGDFKQALFHLEKAQNQSPSTAPDIRSKIETALKDVKKKVEDEKDKSKNRF